MKIVEGFFITWLPCHFVGLVAFLRLFRAAFAGLAVGLLLGRAALLRFRLSQILGCLLVLNYSGACRVSIFTLLILRIVLILFAFELLVVVSEVRTLRNCDVAVEKEVSESDLVVERQRAILTSFAIAVKALFYHVDLSIARHISMIVLGSLSTSLSTILPMLA